jgi:hypothetical protein
MRQKMRLLPEFGVLGSDPLFDMSYPKSGAELTETSYRGWTNLLTKLFDIGHDIDR